MRIEGDRDHLTITGERTRLGDHRLMASVHTVEDTDDDHSLAHEPEAYACVLALFRQRRP